MIASVSGRLILNFVPLPGVEEISTRPRSRSMFRRTTSRPTPRPEISVIFFRRGKSGGENELKNFLVRQRRAGHGQPALDGFFQNSFSLFKPAPSSSISTTMLPP